MALLHPWGSTHLPAARVLRESPPLGLKGGDRAGGGEALPVWTAEVRPTFGELSGAPSAEAENTEGRPVLRSAEVPRGARDATWANPRAPGSALHRAQQAIQDRR